MYIQIRAVFNQQLLTTTCSQGQPLPNFPTWGQKPMYIRRNLPMVERVFKILKLIVISPHDSIKCQSWEGFEKIAFYHYKKAHFYTVGQNQLF